MSAETVQRVGPLAKQDNAEHDDAEQDDEPAQPATVDSEVPVVDLSSSNTAEISSCAPTISDVPSSLEIIKPVGSICSPPKLPETITVPYETTLPRTPPNSGSVSPDSGSMFPTMSCAPPPYLPVSAQPLSMDGGTDKETRLYYAEIFKLQGSMMSRFHDIWATALFVGVVLGCVAITAILTKKAHGLHENDVRFVGSLLFTVLATTMCLSLVYTVMVRFFPAGVIWTTGIVLILFCLAMGVTYLVRAGDNGNKAAMVPAGVVFLLLGILVVFCLISWVPRMPFSVLMLETSTHVMAKHGHIYTTTFLGGIATAGITVWYTFTLLALFSGWNKDDQDDQDEEHLGKGQAIGLICFLSFAFFWITEVLKNIIHVTLSGVHGSWYFCAEKPCGFPKKATRSAFFRAMTYSFGSISYGSLLLTIIRLLNKFARTAGRPGLRLGIFHIIVFCIARFILPVLDVLVQFINEYAFSYVALFGSSYTTAAKATWRMMKDRGVSHLVDENLIDSVLSLGSYFVGFVCFLLGIFLGQFVHANSPLLAAFEVYDEESPFDMTGSVLLVGLWAFFVGVQLCSTFLLPIKGGITTLFVAMAFDPEVLKTDHPDLYKEILELYPEVAIAVPQASV